MSAKLAIAVVGFGAIGRQHARNLANIEGVDFAGVVDPLPEARTSAESRGYRTFLSVEDLLKNPLDGAVVSVPTALHYPISLQLIDAGIGVLIEKPIAQTIEQGTQIIARSRSRGLPLMVGYVERFNPAVIAAQGLIRDGLVGTPLQVTTRRVGTWPARVRDANVIVDIGVHDIDLISFLLQTNLTLLDAQGGMAVFNDRIDYASLTMDAGGVAANALVNWVTPVKIRDMTITGLAGFLQVDYLRQQTHFAPGRDFVVTESYEDFITQYEEGVLLECPVVRREPLRLELEKFVSLLHGAECPDPEIALGSLRIALEATEMIESKLRLGATT
jgi:UDP-N-acetylglucosamine 3-dehydrogenase